jgi:Asp-tRNA(Asn)/Glu-tRNA(Gln) amidotransferase A subunit family amidase
MTSLEICFMTDREFTERMCSGELSATEVMTAHIEQIERVNPKVNAIVTFLPERDLQGAKADDEEIARRKPLGPLHGLPIAHKDLVDTQGILTTFGSPNRDQRHQDGDLSGLDALLLLYFGNRSSDHIGTLWVYVRGASGRGADRRASSI